MHRYILSLMCLLGLVAGYSGPCAAADADIVALEHVLDEWAIAWSSCNPDKLLALFTEDTYYEDVTFGAINRGKDALRKFAMDGCEAFPGWTFQLTSRFVGENGKWGGLEWVWRGRQTKDLPGLPATNTPFEVRGATVVEFRDGRISRNSDYWDLATFLKKVGLTK